MRLDEASGTGLILPDAAASPALTDGFGGNTECGRNTCDWLEANRLTSPVDHEIRERNKYLSHAA